MKQEIADYKELRKKCELLQDNQFKFGQSFINIAYPLAYHYKIELEGEENIPTDTNVIFVINHSNSHDILTAYKFLSMLKQKRKGSVMVATDCLSPLTNGLFKISNATTLDRRVQEERALAPLIMSNKIFNGYDGVIFGEGTWNLHPFLLMHNVHKGASLIAAITQRPVVPVIMEYIEKDGLYASDSELYEKCVIRFCKPIEVKESSNLITQTNIIKDSMIQTRKELWKDNNRYREKLSDIDPLEYINHVYVKKFKALGFTYHSLEEQKFLLFLKGEAIENEYTLNENGILVPGITEKNEYREKVKLLTK